MLETFLEYIYIYIYLDNTEVLLINIYVRSISYSDITILLINL